MKNQLVVSDLFPYIYYFLVIDKTTRKVLGCKQGNKLLERRKDSEMIECTSLPEWSRRKVFRIRNSFNTEFGIEVVVK